VFDLRLQVFIGILVLFELLQGLEEELLGFFMRRRDVDICLGKLLLQAPYALLLMVDLRQFN
jgi:hypothetical protein